MAGYPKNLQFYKFSAYGFLKNLRFFDPFMILYLTSVGVSYTQVGTLYAIRELVSFFMEIPSGIISDRWGRKGALVFCFAVYILSFLLLYWTPDFMWLIMAFVLYGVADSFRTGTHKAMIMDYLAMNNWSQYKIDYYGHTRAWSQRGSAVSSLVAAVLVFTSGEYSNIFLYSVIPYVLDMLLVMSYPKVLNTSLKQKQDSAQSLATFVKQLAKTCSSLKVLSIINTSALHSAYLKGIKDFIQPIMATLAAGIAMLSAYSEDARNGLVVGVLYFFVYGATSIASTQAGPVTQRYKGKMSLPKLTLYLGLISGFLAGLFYKVDSLVLAILFFTGVYIIENLRKPVLTGYVADEVPEEMLASVISVQSFINTIMAAGISFTFGWLADHFGIANALMVLSGILMVLSYGVQKAVKLDTNEA